jgi:photosystem II stability/assembly factor-like uncharacterized protein
MKNLAIKALTIILFSVMLISLFNPGFHPALSSDGMWTTSWPSGGIIYGVAVDPTNPSIVYAASASGGFFRSADGGASWSAINNGLSGLFTSEIAVQPNSPSTLYGYADYAVWKSINSGGSWTKAFNSSYVYQIVFDPNNPAAIYIGTNFGLIRTQNNGRSWDTINPNGQEIAVFDVAIDPQNSNVLYASVANLSDPAVWFGIFKSTDTGDTWTPVNSGISDTKIRSITVDKQIPSQVYACSEAGKVFKSSNSGESWKEVYNRAGCFDIVASGGTVYSAQSSVSKSSDGGDTWSDTATPFMVMESSYLTL